MLNDFIKKSIKINIKLKKVFIQEHFEANNKKIQPYDLQKQQQITVITVENSGILNCNKIKIYKTHTNKSKILKAHTT